MKHTILYHTQIMSLNLSKICQSSHRFTRFAFVNLKTVAFLMGLSHNMVPGFNRPPGVVVMEVRNGPPASDPGAEPLCHSDSGRVASARPVEKALI